VQHIAANETALRAGAELVEPNVYPFWTAQVPA